MIEKKYAEPRIETFEDTELHFKAAECLTRIHVITGWVIPNDKSYIKILAEEFAFKLKEDFYMLNFSEVAHAFRKFGIGTKDWGKSMNLDLICNILATYSEDRRKLSIEEERLKPPVEIKKTQDQLDDITREEIEEQYQNFLNKKSYSEYIENCFTVLCKDGYVAFDVEIPLVNVFKFAKKIGLKRLYININEKEETKEDILQNNFSSIETEVNKLYENFLKGGVDCSHVSNDIALKLIEDKRVSLVNIEYMLELRKSATNFIKSKSLEPTEEMIVAYAAKIAVIHLFEAQSTGCKVIY